MTAWSAGTSAVLKGFLRNGLAGVEIPGEVPAHELIEIHVDPSFSCDGRVRSGGSPGLARPFHSDHLADQMKMAAMWSPAR
jgi:hypothetical protein